jgi:phosphate transport system permease protein
MSADAAGSGGSTTALLVRRAVPGRARTIDRISRLLLLGSAAVSIVIVLLVVVFIAVRAWPVVSQIGLGSFFLSTVWDPDSGIAFGGTIAHFGALTPILGSLLAVGLALLFAVPIAVAVAVVLAETDRNLGERVLRPAIEVFVGIPSVVYGYVGFVVLLPILAHLAPAGDNGSGYLAAGVVLAIMIIPTIATLSADALITQPAALREGSYALGATEWQTISRVVLPAARGGIISGVVLGLARAMGEALAVALVIGDVQRLPDFLHQGFRAFAQPGTTMTVTITDGVNNLAINPQGTAARYMLALVLLVVVFISITVVRLVNRRGRVVV